MHAYLQKLHVTNLFADFQHHWARMCDCQLIKIKHSIRLGVVGGGGVVGWEGREKRIDK